MRFFTLEEANQLLPRLEDILARMEKKRRTHEKLHDELLMEDLLRQASGRRDEHLFPEERAQFLDEMIEELSGEIDEIRSLGCFLRKISRGGWVDFPAERNGDAIFYVWKRGEKTIRHYRTAEEASELLPV